MNNEMEVEQCPKWEWNCKRMEEGRRHETQRNRHIHNEMNTFDPDVRITHKLSFISLTFVILTSLLCVSECCCCLFGFFYSILYSNLHPTSKSITFFVQIFSCCFQFLLGVGCACPCTVVHFKQCLFFRFYISFSIPQLPPPFTCSLRIQFVLFLPSIPLHRFTLLFFSFLWVSATLSSVVGVFPLNFTVCTVYYTHTYTKRYQVVVPFYSTSVFPQSPLIYFACSLFYYYFYLLQNIQFQ